VKRLLTENLSWKLLSLGIAIGLWVLFVGETEIATSLPVAVQYKNVPHELEVVTEQLDRVFLRVRGPATRLNASTLRDVRVVFDLAAVHGAGERTFTLGSDNLQLPVGVDVIRVVPSQVRLMIDKRITREVPVEIHYAGPPPPGYRITKQEVSPDKVRVVGPERRLMNLQRVQTDSVDLAATVGDATFRVPASISDPQVRFENLPPTITVSVFLEKIPQ
jgi:YbbR domain-containing protein